MDECTLNDIKRELDRIDYSKPPQDSRVAEALAFKRIKKVVSRDLEYFIFDATTEAHLVIPAMYCSCLDFLINVAIKCSRKYCYHLLAVEYAKRRGRYIEKRLTLEEALQKAYRIIISGRLD